MRSHMFARRVWYVVLCCCRRVMDILLVFVCVIQIQCNTTTPLVDWYVRRYDWWLLPTNEHTSLYSTVEVASVENRFPPQHWCHTTTTLTTHSSRVDAKSTGSRSNSTRHHGVALYHMIHARDSCLLAKYAMLTGAIVYIYTNTYIYSISERFLVLASCMLGLT